MRPADPARETREAQYLIREMNASEAEAVEIAAVLVRTETVEDVLAMLGEPESCYEPPAGREDDTYWEDIRDEHRWKRSLSWWERWPHVSFSVQEHYDGRIGFVYSDRNGPRASTCST